MVVHQIQLVLVVAQTAYIRALVVMGEEALVVLVVHIVLHIAGSVGTIINNTDCERRNINDGHW